ncbi:MAG: glycosyltransferase family 4 protein [Bacteroidales bacterium]|nr:glycosyltransferase family 4 protein [Bacteroidales bacterium]
MKVLMFGWEFPPHISGGLGTACYGLTKALYNKDVEIIFVVPKAFGDEDTSQIKILSASQVVNNLSQQERKNIDQKISFVQINSTIIPYIGQQDYYNIIHSITPTQKQANNLKLDFKGGYGENLLEEVERYAFVAASIAKQNTFDVIHAHDWLCYKAGVIAKQISNKPLIVHVHATEYDRSGENINQEVYQVEKYGMDNADKIVAVSDFTRNIIINKYHQNPDKVLTIHNGVEQTISKEYSNKTKNKKIVSFIGRITFQKGPDYFIEAAEKVLKKDKNFLFIMAGKGDMLNKMVALVAKKRISKNFLFTGFLESQEVNQLLSQSDMFIMPSVSEPFGIAPLEAMQHSVPTIISKQSGVSEVLHNAIKVDFWDTDAIANAIYAIGNYKTLSNMLSIEGKAEAINTTWSKAAEKLVELYNQLTK